MRETVDINVLVLIFGTKEEIKNKIIRHKENMNLIKEGDKGNITGRFGGILEEFVDMRLEKPDN